MDFEILKSYPEIADKVTIQIKASDLLEYDRHMRAEQIKEFTSLLDDHITSEVRLLTPKEASEKLKVSLVTLWNWDNRGILKPVRIGNKKRYRSSDIENALKPIKGDK